VQQTKKQKNLATRDI